MEVDSIVYHASVVYRCTSRGRLNRPLVVGLREEEESSKRSFHLLLQQQFLQACNCKHWTLFSGFFCQPGFYYSPSLDPFRYRGYSTPFWTSFLRFPFFFLFFPNDRIPIFIGNGIFISGSSSIYEKCFNQTPLIHAEKNRKWWKESRNFSQFFEFQDQSLFPWLNLFVSSI